MTTLTIADIERCLSDVKDPEIPVLSITDLGIVKKIELHNDHVTVVITPTFVGCPAMDLIREEIISALKRSGIHDVSVETSFDVPWSSDDITEAGRKALKQFGLAAPGKSALFKDLDIMEDAVCPRCDGKNTELRSPFGPTLCRAIYYCHTCREAFEQFKPI